MLKLLSFANNNGLIISSQDLPIPRNGTGVFTTIKVKENIPLFFEKHLERLNFSSEELGLKVSLDSLQKEVNKTLEKNQKKACAIRITLPETGFAIHAYELPAPSLVRLITVDDTRICKNLKIIDRSINEKAMLDAKEQGADDAIFVQAGKLIESTYCNLISVNKKGQIITPPITGNALAGIARQLIMETIFVKEENISMDTGNPFVLTNCLRVQKAVSLDKRLLQDGTNLLQTIQAILERKEKEYMDKRL